MGMLPAIESGTGKRIRVKAYSAERKEALQRRMMPPENKMVSELARETGITEQTLYTWRRQLKAQGVAVPGKGLFAEQISTWRQACMAANANAAQSGKGQRGQSKDDQKRIRALEKELNRKEKALAEVAALLVLRKKAQAIWGDEAED